MDYLVASERFPTARFLLRSYMPGDGPLLTEALNASYDHLAPWMPWANPVQTIEESEEFARCARGRYLLAQEFMIAIVDPDGTRFLGSCGYHLREGPLAHRSAEIGMWIRSSHAGQGLGTEVLRALLDWGFSDWPFVRLSWRCNSQNKASLRTAEKVGMVHEGVLRSQVIGPGHHERRDTVVFSMLRSDWDSKQ